MKFLEVSVTTTHLGSDLVCDLLSNYSSEGVSVEDFYDVLDLEKSGKTWDYIDEKVTQEKQGVTVKAYIELDNPQMLESIKKGLENLKITSPFDMGSLSIETAQVDGDKWKEEWKNHFKPIPIGNVVIVPSWIEYQKKANELEIILDSNMAFGTGEHETTSMCVEYLQKYVNERDTVLDVGSGSGILGITASKLGAKEVIMTDIDECAVQASIHNSEINGVKNAKVLLKNLLDDNIIKGNVIVCNIMAEVLIYFADYIGKNLMDKGIVILSGILKDRLDKVIKAYENNGFKFIESKTKGEWSAVVLGLK